MCQFNCGIDIRQDTKIADSEGTFANVMQSKLVTGAISPSRYEEILWPQARQLLLALDYLDRHKPLESGHSPGVERYDQLPH
jgi:hypothetical protein